MCLRVGNCMSLRKINVLSVFKFSFPVIISQSCDSLILFTGRYLLAKINPLFATAALTGGMTAFLLWVFGVGLLCFITALVSQYRGAGQFGKSIKVVPQGIWLSILLSLPLFFFGNSIASFYFKFLKIPSEEYIFANQYLSIVIMSCLFVFIKVVFSSFFSGIGKTKIVMMVNIFGLIFNIPLCFFLIYYGIFGKYTGIEGAALGMFISELFMTLVYVYLFMKKYSKNLKWFFEKEIIKKLIYLGSPMGFEFFAFTFVFNTFLTIFHSFGSSAAVSISITMSWCWLTVLPVLGLNVGVMSLVGHAMGENNPAKAVQVTKSALIIAFFIVFIASIFFLFFSNELISAFDPNLIQNKLLQSMIKTLPIYCFFDALSFVLTGVLRAAGDSKYCFKVGATCQWVFLLICYFGVTDRIFTPFFVWQLFILTLFIQALAYAFRYSLGNWKKLRII